MHENHASSALRRPSPSNRSATLAKERTGEWRSYKRPAGAGERDRGRWDRGRCEAVASAGGVNVATQLPAMMTVTEFLDWATPDGSNNERHPRLLIEVLSPTDEIATMDEVLVLDFDGGPGGASPAANMAAGRDRCRQCRQPRLHGSHGTVGGILPDGGGAAAMTDLNPSSLSGFQRRFAAKVGDEKQSNRSKLEPTAVPGFEERFATKILEEKRQRRERDAAAKATSNSSH